MTHKIVDVSDYHAGDALDLKVTVEDSGGVAVDLTNASAEWLLKTNATDSDTNALLSKTVAGGGISLTDTANGKLEVSIETNDTDGLSGQKHHRLRVTDSNGDRVTVFHGTMTIEV